MARHVFGPVTRQTVFDTMRARALRGFALAALPLLTAACPSTPPPDAISKISFRGDWETGITGNGNWKNRQADLGPNGQPAPDRLQRRQDSVRQGQWAARVEVRENDAASQDDKQKAVERSEVVYMTRRDGSLLPEKDTSGTQWYGFSVRLDPSWQPMTTASTSCPPPAFRPNRRPWAIIL